MSAQAPAAQRISPAEWRWLAAASLLLMAFVSLPYVIGLAASTPQMAFGGHLFGISDMHSYIAKMRWGARAGWLLELVYTSEPHRGGFAQVHFLALGKLVALVSGEGAHVSAETLTTAYHAARVACGLLLLGVMYCFIADYLAAPAQRRLAWAIAALAGGLGWLPVTLSLLRAGGEAPLPVEFYVPEAFSLLLLYGLPHLALARALLLGGWLLLFRALEGGRWRLALAAGATWAGMAILVPFYAALLGVLIAVWLAARTLARRAAVWPEMRLAALAGALPAALLVYNAWLFTSNPIFAAWSAQNSLPSPPPGQMLLAYGLLLALAIPGAVSLRQAGDSARRALLLIWPPVAALLIYLPINVQRRLLEGVVLPLSILAALGIWRLVGEKPEAGRPALHYRLRQAAAALVLLTIFPSTLMLVGGGALTAAHPAWPVFHPADEREALRWLRDEAPPDSIVLAMDRSGNVLPAYAGVRVYVGHGPETINGPAKRQQAEAFFLGGMTDETRRALLAEGGIDYVWVGPEEQPPGCRAGCFNPAALGLRPVFSAGDYTIYRVEGADSTNSSLESPDG